MLKQILKIFIVIIGVFAVSAFLLWFVWIEGNPWWVGLAIILGILGLLIAFIYLKKYFLRRREKEFVRSVIAQDEAAIKRAPVHERTHLKELQEKWKESVELLRGSYLRKKGNPLYVLPWYLILGESGAGKTSAIKNTNLNSPITEVSRTTGISVTRNCDWWFFEEAIILDTAGRYTIPIDEGVDKEEWEEFLTLLAKYRRREPLNGIIVTIAADKLLELHEAQLSDEGHSVRKRIDQLIRILGAKFPIYVLVTKLDLVQGMVEFTNLIPKQARDQAMGYVNKQSTHDWKTVLDQTFTSVAERIKTLQLIMVHQEDFIEPEIFLFNNNFERLRLGLELYVRAVFEQNPYQETPLCRGVFFSSAIQEGKLPPESEKMFGVNKKEIQDIGHNNGLFLKDIFKKILPKDRNLFIPIQEFLSWYRLTRNMVLLSWILLWLSAGGIMSFSYIVNLNAFNVAKRSLPQPEIIGDFAYDMHNINTFRSRISEMERANHKWFIRWFGFRYSLAFEVKLKIKFLQLFRDEILYPFDSELVKNLSNTDLTTKNESFWEYFNYYNARITLLRDYLKNRNSFSMEHFIAISGDIMKKNYPDLTSGTVSMFGDSYHDYLLWNEDTKEFNRQLFKFQEILNNLLQKNRNLNAILLNSIEGVPDVRMSDFWGGSEYGGQNKIIIRGTYTHAGQQQLEELLDKMEKAVVDTSVISDEKREFWSQYQLQFYDEWNNFSRSFYVNSGELRDSKEWKYIAALMTSENNPHFQFMESMADEFSQLPQIHQEPSWVSLVRELDEVRKLTEKNETAKPQSLLSKIEDQKDKIVQKTIEKTDSRKVYEEKIRQEAAIVLSDYVKAIIQIAPALTSREFCFQMVSNSSQSPLAAAENTFLKLQSILGSQGNLSPVWDHIIAPQRFLADYAIKETACVLQAQWEEQVLGGLKGVVTDEIPTALFSDSGGLVWQFLDTSGKPFITRDRRGYSAREILDRKLPFKAAFFDFINSGPESIINFKPEYIVTMETLPIEVNSGARVKPQACTLGLRCSDEMFILENYNYPQSKTFLWSPDKCGDATITILFPDNKIVKIYGGNMGFATLLSEFRDGSRTFRADEFSRNKSFLDTMNISWIRLSYKITGSKDVLQLLEKKPLRVPMEIVDCWSP
ncbi:MAG: hypothetical protein JXB48_02075 [Candidatus Latescibacteria bacterium]|nr:hypothetical protein [Candidatus Latescibacterota bacterium]